MDCDAAEEGLENADCGRRSAVLARAPMASPNHNASDQEQAVSVI